MSPAHPVLIMDDAVTVRRLIAPGFGTVPGVEVAATASDSALALTRAGYAAAVHPVPGIAAQFRKRTLNACRAAARRRGREPGAWR